MGFDAEGWLNAIALLVFAVFFGGVLLVGAPSQWPLIVQVLYIAGVVAYWMVWVRRRSRK